MESILQTLGQSIGIWCYVVLFFYSFGGGMIALVAASILSSGIIESSNSLNIFICICVASFANFLGSSFLFYVSRFQKQLILNYFKDKRKIALGHIWIKKYSYFIIFIHKYLYGIKTIIPIVIGLSKFSKNKFFAWNFLSSFVWGFVVGGVSYIMGDMIKKMYDKYSNPYIFPFIGLFIVALVLVTIGRVARKY